MIARIIAVAVLLAGAAFALWRPAPHQAVVALTPSPDSTDGSFGARPHRTRLKHRAGDVLESDPIVYVAGAVRHPGLYRLNHGDRYDRAVALAGGFGPDADTTGVDLAQQAADGDEVFVPHIGDATYRKTSRSRASHRSSRRHRRTATAPPEGSVDVNNAMQEELARVPGIGRAIAGRIIELRDREGAFNSLDELLDVAGMTQSRLARARPYLQELDGAEGSPH
jgi:competence protein ComEA